MSRRSLVQAVGLLALAVVLLFAWVLTRQGEEGSVAGHLLPGQELSTVPGVSIKRSMMTGGSSSTREGDTLLEAEGISFQRLIEFAYQVPQGGIAYETGIPPGVYDVSVTAPPGGRSDVPGLLSGAIRKIFGIAGRYETRKIDALLLSCRLETPLEFSPSTAPAVPGKDGIYQSSYRNDWNQAKFRGDLPTFAAWLQKHLGVPVADTTGIKGSYETVVTWDSSPGNTLVEVLEKRGLIVRAGRHPLPVLVVEKAGR